MKPNWSCSAELVRIYTFDTPEIIVLPFLIFLGNVSEKNSIIYLFFSDILSAVLISL